jgi:hypothetical protein
MHFLHATNLDNLDRGDGRARNQARRLPPRSNLLKASFMHIYAEKLRNGVARSVKRPLQLEDTSTCGHSSTCLPKRLARAETSRLRLPMQARKRRLSCPDRPAPRQVLAPAFSLRVTPFGAIDASDLLSPPPVRPVPGARRGVQRKRPEEQASTNTSAYTSTRH